LGSAHAWLCQVGRTGDDSDRRSLDRHVFTSADDVSRGAGTARRSLSAKQLLVKHDSFHRRASVDAPSGSMPLGNGAFLESKTGMPGSDGPRRLARSHSSNSADLLRSSTGSLGTSRASRRSVVRFRFGDFLGSGRLGRSTSRRMLAKRHDGSDLLADDPANGIVAEPVPNGPVALPADVTLARRP
jgi:hypothetical protein